jgi:hypothetical protein
VQIVKSIRLLADLVCRLACRACIERCHVVAGRFDCGDAVSAAFFNKVV